MSYLNSDNITLNIIILADQTVLKELVNSMQANQNSSKLSCDRDLSAFLPSNVKSITVLYRIVRMNTYNEYIQCTLVFDNLVQISFRVQRGFFLKILTLLFLQDFPFWEMRTHFQTLNFYWYCILSHTLLAVSFNIKIDHHDCSFSQQNNVFQGIVLRPHSRKN